MTVFQNWFEFGVLIRVLLVLSFILFGIPKKGDARLKDFRPYLAFGEGSVYWIRFNALTFRLTYLREGDCQEP